MGKGGGMGREDGSAVDGSVLHGSGKIGLQ